MRGQGTIEARYVGGQTSLTRTRGSYPLKLLVPRWRGCCSWVYTGTMGGGLVDGDRIDVTVTVGSGATLFIGSQASTKTYRSPTGVGCAQRLDAHLEGTATLVVAPDPVTCFAGSRYEQMQNFEICEASNLVVLDWMSSGRWATGERWDFSYYASRTEVSVAGKCRVAEAVVRDPQDG